MISTTSNKEIQKQVYRIKNYPAFSNSRILSAFLEFIVAETLLGREDFLKEYVIATNVLKKSQDFNPQLDAIVRIHARRLRQSLDDYYHEVGQLDPIVISVPKGRYIPKFEIKDSPESVPIDDVEITHENQESLPVLAVFPFFKSQESKRLDVVCSILCQELSVEFSRFPEFDVISNYSVQTAIKKSSNREDICKSIGIDYLILGSCFEQKEGFEVTVELNRVSEDKVVWADSYFIKDLKGVELASYKAVVQKIIGVNCGYFGVVYRNTLNRHEPLDFDYLYAIYLHNNYHQVFTEDAFKEAYQAVEVGLKHNPESALLLAFKGELILNLLVMDVPGKGFLRIGTELVQHAINLDRNCQHAYQVMAWSNMLHHDVKEFNRSVEQMIAVNPYNSYHLGEAGFGYVCMGDYEKGLQYMSESTQLNPYYPWNVNIGFCFYYIHHEEYEEALYWAKLIDRKHFFWDPLLRASVLGNLGQIEEAEIAFEELLKLSPNFKARAKTIVNLFIFDLNLQAKILKGFSCIGIQLS